MEKEIKCDVLKIFDEKQTSRGKTRIQIISWNGRSPVIEKRDYWEDEDGNEKTGKLRGINNDDFSILIENQDEIEKLMSKK